MLVTWSTPWPAVYGQRLELAWPGATAADQATLDLYEAVRQCHDNVGPVLQAYLRRQATPFGLGLVAIFSFEAADLSTDWRAHHGLSGIETAVASDHLPLVLDLGLRRGGRPPTMSSRWLPAFR